MLVFDDVILRQCSKEELASLLMVAENHKVESQRDYSSENKESIKTYLQKIKQQEEDECQSQQELEKRFM